MIEALRKWTERNPVQNERRGQCMNRNKIINTYMARQEGLSQATCVYCNREDHKGIVCEKVKDIKDRRTILSEKQLCFNCVKRGHRSSECKSTKCYNCKRKHTYTERPADVFDHRVSHCLSSGDRFGKWCQAPGPARYMCGRQLRIFKVVASVPGPSDVNRER